MRTREGVGRVAPAPERVRLADEDLSLARTLTRRRMEHRRYDARDDEWGFGYLGPVRAVYVGFVGEVAFRNWARSRLGVVVGVDDAYRPAGDRGVDFVVCGYRVQVKTATSPYDELLVRTRDAAAPAEDCQVGWDVCFRLQWPPRRDRSFGRGLFGCDERVDRCSVDLCGVVWAGDFHRVARLQPGRGVGEWNYAVAPTDFLPVSTFLDKCRARTMRADRDAS